MLDHRVVRDRGGKGQGALGAHHHMFEDFKGIIEIHQGVEAVARGIFNLEFMADAITQFRIGLDLIMQIRKPLKDFGFLTFKFPPALVITGVQHGPVVEDQTNVGDGFIGIFRHPAAHARGVVPHDPADAGRVDGGRVRSDLATEFRQPDIGPAADDPGFQGDFLGIVKDIVAFKPPAHADQDGIGYRLAGETGASGPEGHGQLALPGLPEQANHFQLFFNHHHHFGDQAVETGVGTIGGRVYGIGEHPVLGQDGFQCFNK